MVRKPPGLGRTYITVPSSVWCGVVLGRRKRYLDLTLLSLDEPPTKGTKELEGQRKSQRARETKWALGR